MIPYCFKNIATTYPETVTLGNVNTRKTTHFFLDFTTVIKACCRQVLAKYKTAEISNDKLELAMLQEIKRELVELKKKVNPTKCLYIAIDGVLPRAKMEPQRRQRFSNASLQTQLLKLKEDYQIKKEASWDMNALLAGTQFQAKVSDYLKVLINSFKDLEVILSDSTVPGEGKYKIFHYIKNTSFDNDVSVIVYGLETSLIRMAMVCTLKTLTLMGTDERSSITQTSNTNQYYLNIPLFKKKLTAKITAKMLIEDSIDCERFIHDYLSLGFLLGNTLLPALTSISTTEGITVLLDIYCTVLLDRKEYLVNGSEINKGFLKSILYNLLNLEDTMVLQNSKDHSLVTSLPVSPPLDYTAAVSLVTHSPPHQYPQNRIGMGTTDWRNRYYKSVFKLDYYQETSEIMDICLNYFEGIEWVSKYYFEDCCSWDWYYPHRHSPTIKELYEYLDLSFSKIALEISEPVSPHEQLLMVLPPQSSHLLPTGLRELMSSYHSPLIAYYPINIQFDQFQKHKRQDCVPRLPQMDYTILKTHYDKISITTKSRNNRCGQDYIKNKVIVKNIQLNISGS